MRLTLLAVLIAASLPAQAADLKALQCGNVFDSKSATLMGPQTIVIEKNTIKSLNPGKLAVEGAQIVDLSQMTCMPGFIDMHVHLSEQSGPQSYSEGFRLDATDYAFRSVAYADKTLMAGFTTVRDLGGNLALHLRDAINQGAIKGPRIYAAGQIIASTGGHGDDTNGLNSDLAHLVGPPGPTEGVVNGVDDARQAVRQRYKDGSDLIKITATGGVLSYAKSGDGPQFTIDEIKAVVDTAKDYGYTVAAHAHGKEGMRRAIIGGVNSIEHGTYMDAEIFKLMKEHGTWYVPTITAGKFVAAKAKIDGYYPEIVRPKAALIGSLIQTTFANAYKAGVKIAFGTDMGVGPHGDNASEFIYMTEAGMPNNIALQTATYNSAQLLAVKELGQLQPGFKADVIAVAGNPLADISLTQKIAFVMKDGVVYKQSAQ